MDFAIVQKKIVEIVKNNKYVILILGIGIILMIFPEMNWDETNKETEDLTNNKVTQLSYAEEIAHILSTVKGAGKVQVMVSVLTGEEKVYQLNENRSSTADSTSYVADTVTITDGERNQLGLIRQINPPKYLGVIVVCQGADDPSVRLAITDAVSKITGLGADRIAVLKMN